MHRPICTEFDTLRISLERHTQQLARLNATDAAELQQALRTASQLLGAAARYRHLLQQRAACHRAPQRRAA